MKKLSQYILFITVLSSLALSSCTEKNNEKDIILSANREAALGWVILTIYKDSSFEFTNSGRRDKSPYSGKARITKDSIFFTYDDSIPYAGEKAFFDQNTVSYVGGKSNENLGITIHKLVPLK